MIRNLLILLVLGSISLAPAYGQDSEESPLPPQETTDDLVNAPDVGDEDMDYSEPYVLQLGVHVGLGAAGINAGDQPDGRKTNVDFWFLPSYGATVLAPFGPVSKRK